MYPRTFRAVQKEDSDADDFEEGNQLLELDSARNSFSLALKGTAALLSEAKLFGFSLFSISRI